MKRTFLFTILASISVLGAVLANILSTIAAPFSIGFLSITPGFLVFPLVYIISDIVSEVYGYRASRKVSWLMTAGNVVMIVTCVIIYLLSGDPALKPLATQSWAIVLASLCAAQLGDWVNDLVFQGLRKLNSSKKFYLIRALGSSIVGEWIDSSIFVIGGLCFVFHLPTKVALATIITGVISKLVIEIIWYPVSYGIVQYLKKIGEEYEPSESKGIFG